MRPWYASEARYLEEWMETHWGLTSETHGQKFKEFLDEYTGLEWNSRFGGAPHRDSYLFYLYPPREIGWEIPLKIEILFGPWTVIASFHPSRTEPSAFQVFWKPPRLHRKLPEPYLPGSLISFPREDLDALTKEAEFLVEKARREGERFPPHRFLLEPGDPLEGELRRWCEGLQEELSTSLDHFRRLLSKNLRRYPSEVHPILLGIYFWNETLQSFFREAEPKGMSLFSYQASWSSGGQLPRLHLGHVFVPYSLGMDAQFSFDRQGEDWKGQLVGLGLQGLSIDIRLI